MFGVLVVPMIVGGDGFRREGCGLYWHHPAKINDINHYYYY